MRHSSNNPPQPHKRRKRYAEHFGNVLSGLHLLNHTHEHGDRSLADIQASSRLQQQAARASRASPRARAAADTSEAPPPLLPTSLNGKAPRLASETLVRSQPSVSCLLRAESCVAVSYRVLCDGSCAAVSCAVRLSRALPRKCGVRCLVCLRVICCAMARVCGVFVLRAASRVAVCAARQTRAVCAHYELVLYAVCLRLYVCAF